jgi:hypothetical protein
VIFTMLLSKNEAQALFDAYTATLGANASAYAKRAHVALPDASEPPVARDRHLTEAAEWFRDRLRTHVDEPRLPYPVWWNPENESAEVRPAHLRHEIPFTSWQLELIDHFSAWYWLTVEAALPHAKRVVRKESRRNHQNQQPTLEIAPKRFTTPVGVIYGWALRLIDGENENTTYLTDHFRETTAAAASKA